ncbi:PEP-CTERM sorting domain-containing protein [Thiohalobacter sp. IOR34]|uniref:PEP-CTERM sorting domain-containing protein n=1 Tax=Thiohalobacter sp. IOR34 TaxID=3057176 RepID=UPI0025B0BCE3|nr:PEP-CTERM sorting domain-containing protein [Thiohalobacter sp. IOR34]WJW76611.1 PEP-CTERM sorting domain-containing protein [Thiohalobacter sp. IOR34]
MNIIRYMHTTVALGLALLLPLVAHAFPIAAPGTEGLKVIVGNSNPIIATYQGNSAMYSNDLYLVQGDGDVFIFNNHSSAVGSQVNLGSFPVGTELVFRLHVNNTGYDYFTGPASRNPDQHVHARVQENWQPKETLVSFEDLYNGPFNYNDLSFSFTNTVTTPPPPPTGGVPEPAVASLFLIGLAASGVAARSKRRR